MHWRHSGRGQAREDVAARGVAPVWIASRRHSARSISIYTERERERESEREIYIYIYIIYIYKEREREREK